jgi:hypothetical protein
MSLYLTFRDRRQELAYRILEVWAFGPKLQFQKHEKSKFYFCEDFIQFPVPHNKYN